MALHRLIHGDARDLKETRTGSIALVVADPPYGLAQEKAKGKGKVFGKDGGSFDDQAEVYETLTHEWDWKAAEDYSRFTLDWMVEARRVCERSGSIFVFISYHNVDLVLNTARLLNLHRVSLITWTKINAPPSIARRQPTQSTEQIVWLSKGNKWIYNYQEAKKYNKGKQLRDFWHTTILHPSESLRRRSQKPIKIVERIIDIASLPGDTVLDPFLGTGTTIHAAHNMGRIADGYEMDQAAVDICLARFVGNDIPVSLYNGKDRLCL